METRYIYTDGSIHRQSGDGGWAFCISTMQKITPKEQGAVEALVFGYAPNTTNNRMELTAVINGLHKATHFCSTARKIVVYTDSKYVSDPVYFGWLDKWREDGYTKVDYHTQKETEVKNADLWEELYQLLKRYRFRKIAVDICWVKGHNGNYLNEVCDQAANKGRISKKINSEYEVV